MSLTPLTWKQLPVQTLTANYTTAQFLDAMFTALTSTTYANGSARTVGSGVAWTFSRYKNASTATEAIHGYPPTNPMNQRVIIAGSVGVMTPVMMYGTTYAAANIHVGLVKNGGTFTTWNGAAPFTTGQFTGYAPFHARSSTLNVQVRVYESQDAIACVVNSTTTTASNFFLAGGIVDPETGDATSDAESDGRLYALNASTPTFTNNINVQGYSNGTPGVNVVAHHPQIASPANGNNKFVALTPGGSALLGLSRLVRNHAVGTSFNSRSNKYVKIPLHLCFTDSLSSYTEPPYTYGGRLREIWITRSAIAGTTLRNGGTDLGYFIGDSINAVGGAYLLSA